jgi:hypothetical protein
MRKLTHKPATATATLLTSPSLSAVTMSAQMKRSPAHDRRGARRRQARGPWIRAAAALFAAATVTTGCSSNTVTSPPAGASHSPAAAASASSAAAGLVGRWERVTTCQELVSELDRAGLAPLAANAWSGQTSSTGLSSFAPGSPKPTNAQPCTGALSREHSHFFSQSGQFGSLDWLGGQVDNGPYRIISDNTVYIGSPPIGATFHYRILHGDTLMLSPVLTTAMLRQALAHPDQFSAAFWAVSVAYAGYTWKRVPCQNWC